MAEAVFVYDDDCGFCTWWAEFVAERADLRLVGFSELGPDLLERLPDDYESCSHLVTDDGVYSCGASVEQALLLTDAGDFAHPLVEALRERAWYADLREWGYRRVADDRDRWGRVLSKTPPARRSRERNPD